MTERELIEELLKLQIRQTEILGQLLQFGASEGDTDSPVVPTPISRQPSPSTTTDSELETEARATCQSEPGPLRVGDQVRILNPVGFRIRKDTVCTVVRVGKRVTAVTPNGVKIVRSAHNLERV